MKLDVTNKHLRCIDEAKRQASLSPCAHKHGCVIAGGGRICARGFNNYRTQFANGINKNCTSCHAEVAAIQNLIRGKSFDQIKVAEE